MCEPDDDEMEECVRHGPNFDENGKVKDGKPKLDHLDKDYETGHVVTAADTPNGASTPQGETPAPPDKKGKMSIFKL